MKSQLKRGLFCCLLMPTCVWAIQPDVKLVDVRYDGSGCPGGSVSTSMTPNKGAINAVFDHFFTLLEGKSSQNIKRCRLSMKIDVPKNKRVRLQQVKFRGFIDLPEDSETEIIRNYRFGNVSKQLSDTWTGEVFSIINQREAFNTKWSKCGKDVMLEIDSRMELRTQSTKRSQSGVDSFDHLMTLDYRGERGWKFILSYTPC